MWFLMLLYGLGATVAILGYVLTLHQSYNPLGDSLLTKKLRRMRLDPSFCEVQPARALYRGGVNNGGCIYESEKVRSKPFPFVPLGRILRAATRNLQSASNACARPASWWPTCVLRAAIREL